MNKYKTAIFLIVAVIILSLVFLGLINLFGSKVSPSEWIQIVLTAVLVSVTAFYAWEARNQALASAQTVEEMKKQTVMQSRPLIIQKAVQRNTIQVFSSDDKTVVNSRIFSHFQILNAGNGPAIELEVSLTDKDKNPIFSHRETYLKPSEEIKFGDVQLLNRKDSKFYLLCQYRPVLSLNADKTWLQTWLPLEVTKGSPGQYYVAPGELTFCEVKEKDRINPFANKPS